MSLTTTQSREAFVEWLRGRAAGEYRGSLDDVVTLEGQPHDLRGIISQLWDCRDALPPASCTAARMPAGSSFAQAVRAEREWLDRRR